MRLRYQLIGGKLIGFSKIEECQKLVYPKGDAAEKRLTPTCGQLRSGLIRDGKLIFSRDHIKAPDCFGGLDQ